MNHTNETTVKRVIDVFIIKMTEQSAYGDRCVYSATGNGVGCAIGCLFPDSDETHKREWDKQDLTYIEDIIANFPYAKQQLSDCDIKLLDAVQRWHDYVMNGCKTQEARVTSLINVVSEFAPSYLNLLNKVLNDFSITG